LASVKLVRVAGCGQVLHQFFGLAAEELVGLAAADEHRLAAARRRRHHAHPGPCREPPEQPGTGNDTPRAAARPSSGGGPSGLLAAQPPAPYAGG
jgi:hypothetical protein